MTRAFRQPGSASCDCGARISSAGDGTMTPFRTVSKMIVGMNGRHNFDIRTIASSYLMMVPVVSFSQGGKLAISHE
jgi:hypothetical protein